MSKERLKPRKRPYMDRAVDRVPIRQRFLIVCEGMKTEPNYFKQYRVSGLKVEVAGRGMVTTSLVEEALRLSNESDDSYDQIWCVFDKDDNPLDQFDNAIQLARFYGMHVAYSNQAFELWYVLHFEFLHTAIDRNSYCQKLSKQFKCEYKKNDPANYHKLKPFRDTAIRNAQRLLTVYPESHPSIDDPSTTVHLLVLELLNQAKPIN